MRMHSNTAVGDGEVMRVLAPWMPTGKTGAGAYKGAADAQRSTRAFEPVLSSRLWLPSAVVSSRLSALSGPKLTHRSIFGGDDVDSLDLADVGDAAPEVNVVTGADVTGEDDNSELAVVKDDCNS